MSKLLKALKEKFKTPQDAIRALGLDASLLDGGSPAPNNSGVVVGKPMELETMNRKTLLSRKAAMAKGAIAVCLQPRLAQDAKLNLNAALLGVTQANWGASKVKIADWLKSLPVINFKDKLAMDAGVADVVKLLDSLDGEHLEEGGVGKDADPDKNLEGVTDPAGTGVGTDSPQEAIRALLEGKISNEDMAKVLQLLEAPAGDDADGDDDVEKFMAKIMERMTGKAAGGAGAGAEGEDGLPDTSKTGKGELSNKVVERPNAGKEPQPQVGKAAMDQAIEKAKKEATAAAVSRMRAIAEAEKAVKPHIGEVMAQDTAEDVYRLALDHYGIDVDGVHPSAFKVMVAMLPKLGEDGAPINNVKQVVLAHDGKSVDAFKQLFPNAGKVRTL